jgi:hypothetical protein
MEKKRRKEGRERGEPSPKNAYMENNQVKLPQSALPSRQTNKKRSNKATIPRPWGDTQWIKKMQSSGDELRTNHTTLEMINQLGFFKLNEGKV